MRHVATLVEDHNLTRRQRFSKLFRCLHIQDAVISPPQHKCLLSQTWDETCDSEPAALEERDARVCPPVSHTVQPADTSGVQSRQGFVEIRKVTRVNSKRPRFEHLNAYLGKNVRNLAIAALYEALRSKFHVVKKMKLVLTTLVQLQLQVYDSN